MDILVCPVNIGIFLLLIFVTEEAQSFPRKFYKRYGKRLDITPFETVLVDLPEECLGVCMFNDRCKAFNADRDNCQLFAEDRCSTGKPLTESPKTSYFDTIAEIQCPGKLQRTLCSSCIPMHT